MAKAGDSNAGRKVSPHHIAHYVIRTNRYEESVAWHKAFFDADVVFANEFITFLSYDHEHHRVAIAKLPGLKDHDPQASGIDHMAFSYQSLVDLMFTYKRLKSINIHPKYCLNHGPTTSIYYEDPNGAQLELQVDNFPTLTESRGFFLRKPSQKIR